MPPRKRGRKPKVPDPNAVSVDPEIEKAAALERNRIAASKSRMRKKERVHNLERSESPQQEPVRAADPVQTFHG